MLEDFLQRRPYNAATDFVDANVARGLGDKIAFIDSDRSLTYASCRRARCRFAAALRTLGLDEESRIVLAFHDTVDYPVAFWGALRAGIVPIPVNTLLTAEQYAYMLADSRAAAAVVAGALLPTLLSIRDRLPRLRTIVVVGAAPMIGRRRGRRTSRVRGRARDGRAAAVRRRRPCRTRSRSGCTRPARPAIPRPSSTSTPA